MNDGDDDTRRRRRGRSLYGRPTVCDGNNNGTYVYTYVRTYVCGDDDCELKGWLTMPGQGVMTSNEDDDDDDDDDDDNDTY